MSLFFQLFLGSTVLLPKKIPSNSQNLSKQIKLIMALEMITKEDLEIFKIELISEIKNLFHFKTTEQKLWLRSSEVKTLLRISSGTLQNLRVNGTLRFSKIGGTIYYNYQDIEKLLQSNNESPITKSH